MNIYECERKAKGSEHKNFLAMFPNGKFVIGEWLDPHMGILTMDLPEMEGRFVMTNQLAEQFPDLICSDLFTFERGLEKKEDADK